MGQSAIDVRHILGELSRESKRPRYAFMVLNLLSEAADHRGQAGPFVSRDGQTLPVREWLGETLARMAESHPRRAALKRRVRADLADDLADGQPADLFATQARFEEAVAERARASGGSNVSRAVSDLVRCGLVKRHYAGIRKGHHNKGGRRHAVYTVEADALAALRRGTQLL